MATEDERSAEGGQKSSTPWSLLPVAAAGLGIAAVAANPRLQSYLTVGAGVFALVSFTSAVLWGLSATDRLILRPVHRLAAQAVHRAMGISGVVFLVLHVWMNLITNEIGTIAAFVPFADANRPVILGLGTAAGYLFPAVAIAGAARGLLAKSGDARRWRLIHVCSYPAWGAALVHGLNAGRMAAVWVVALYGLAVVGVVIALALRLAVQDRSGPRLAAARPRLETDGPDAPRLPTAADRDLADTITMTGIRGQNG